MSRELQPCGTYAAYRRHLSHGEYPCQPCTEAAAAHQRKVRGTKPRVLAPCGTVGAYHRHIRSNETPCDDCRKAWALYMVVYKAATRCAS